MPDGVTVNLAGAAELLARLELAQQTIIGALAAELYVEAELVMTDSKANFVPVLTGALRSSGYVEQPVVSGNEISVTLGYGGAASAYALKQHEDLSLNHPNGGTSKFLERPLLEHAATMPAEIAARVRAAAGLA